MFWEAAGLPQLDSMIRRLWDQSAYYRTPLRKCVLGGSGSANISASSTLLEGASCQGSHGERTPARDESGSIEGATRVMCSAIRWESCLTDGSCMMHTYLMELEAIQTDREAGVGLGVGVEASADIGAAARIDAVETYASQVRLRKLMADATWGRPPRTVPVVEIRTADGLIGSGCAGVDAREELMSLTVENYFAPRVKMKAGNPADAVPTSLEVDDTLRRRRSPEGSADSGSGLHLAGAVDVRFCCCCCCFREANGIQLELCERRPPESRIQAPLRDPWANGLLLNRPSVPSIFRSPTTPATRMWRKE